MDHPLVVVIALLLTFAVDRAGQTGELVGLAAISHPGGAGELADPHGLRVRPT